jgi:hypothetical protein
MNLERVGDVLESVLRRDPCCPSFDGRPFNLDGAPTCPAHQVVVVLAAATAIHGLTVRCAQHVDRPRVDKRLQRSVHRRQSDVLSATSQDDVQVLSASKLVEILQRRRNGGPLASSSQRRSARCHAVTSLVVRRSALVSARRIRRRVLRGGAHRARSRRGHRAGVPGARRLRRGYAGGLRTRRGCLDSPGRAQQCPQR